MSKGENKMGQNSSANLDGPKSNNTVHINRRGKARDIEY